MRGTAIVSRPAVLAFVSGKGGVGTTSTAAGVVLALVRAAAGPAAAVSVRSGPGSLHYRFTRRAGPPPGELWWGESVAAPGQQLPALTVVDSGAWPLWSPQGDLVGLSGRLRDSHPLTLIDVGDVGGDAAHRLLARADRVVLVTTPAADSVASAATALHRVRHLDPARLAALVVVVVCLDARQHRWAAHRLRPAGHQTVLVPFDPVVAAGELPAPGSRAWPAYRRIAGLLAGPVTTSDGAVPR
jgi:MinD-like ATPase involved in chromosome partitioning or flagellar assembly